VYLNIIDVDQFALCVTERSRRLSYDLACSHVNFLIVLFNLAVAQWLRYCATNRKVAGSIPDGVIGIFL
jgi:hypothetical protein